jgi:hypothetical protein
MSRSYKPGIDWPTIRERWEAGETGSEIARTADVTRQAIGYRVAKEGWTRKATTPESTRGELASLGTVAAIGRRTDENAALVLTELQAGAHPPLAARRIGMAPETLVAWMRDNPDFGQRCVEAQLAYTRSVQSEVRDAVPRDWKAGAWLLERHPLTKDAYKGDVDKRGQGITVVINMPDRAAEPIIIEGSAE